MRKKYRKVNKKPKVVTDFAESRLKKAAKSVAKFAKEHAIDKGSGAVSDAASGAAESGVKKAFKYGGAALGSKLGPAGTVAGAVVGGQVGAKADRDLERSRQKGKIDRKRFKKRYKKERSAGKSRRQAATAASGEVAKKSMKTWKTMRKAEKWRAKQGKGPGMRSKVTQGLVNAVPGSGTASKIVGGTKRLIKFGRKVAGSGKNKYRYQMA